MLKLPVCKQNFFEEKLLSWCSNYVLIASIYWFLQDEVSSQDYAWPAASYSDSVLILFQNLFSPVYPFLLVLLNWFGMPWLLQLPSFDRSLGMQLSEQLCYNSLHKLLFHAQCFFLFGWCIWWHISKTGQKLTWAEVIQVEVKVKKCLKDVSFLSDLLYVNLSGTVSVEI